jgi:hypothetical protein
MDPVLMAGAWAGAILAVAALLRLSVKLGVRAVRAAVKEELGRLWKELDSQDDYFHGELLQLREEVRSLRAEFRPNGGGSLRDSVDRLERMVTDLAAGR